MILNQCCVSMTQLRELENHHHEEVTDLALSTLERFAKSQLEGELVDDLRTVIIRGIREYSKYQGVGYHGVH